MRYIIIVMEERIKDLIDKFSNLIYKIAYFSLDNISDIDDVVQDVFYTICKKYCCFKDKNDLDMKYLLIKITRNKSLNYNKIAWRRRVVLLEDFIKDYQNKDYLLELSEIKNEINSLSDKYKDVFILYLKGYTGKEISKKLKISEENVRTRIKRAKEKLKDNIYGVEEDYE